ncbi:N-acetyltransferase [Staphylococcus sp. SQ8-PEA]|uniref:N-acetyltransferase n=1 Tax=Staphylococcus marylandisciuri TaxID=2981529 RepID=A0ABT2QSP7_9STAP|nr:N-acetyltransferase [Staphylococcus marylandisciuri]MCU5747014.1 N-acetyltransferase [Staphylococcus marylandisciuri]
MQIYLSTITENDYEESLETIERSFESVEYGNHEEHKLVAQLRRLPEYHYELEVVAKDHKGSIIGHVMLSEVKIDNEDDSYIALLLAPLSVIPEYQHQGIGKALVQAVEERAKTLDYTTIVVLGDPNYYNSLGYETAANHGITVPFKIAPQDFMVKFLWEHLEIYPKGEVVFPVSFN